MYIFLTFQFISLFSIQVSNLDDDTVYQNLAGMVYATVEYALYIVEFYFQFFFCHNILCFS